MTSGDIAGGLAALDECLEAAGEQLEPQLRERAEALVERAGRRTAFSGSTTVVALAGATGSGKSSLFNALIGADLSPVGTTRPTSSQATAAGWGGSLPHDLLDWLAVPHRHLVAIDPGLGTELLLLDLPDHDSLEADHRLAVDRLVELVDAMVWVVDPQKYADAALHDGYLRPLAAWSSVMMLVFNQSDTLSPKDLERCVADLRRLLDEEGLADSALLVTSATTGAGVAQLRQTLRGVAETKKAAGRRIAADLRVIADELASDLGPAAGRSVPRSAKEELVVALAEAARVPEVVRAVKDSWLRRGELATGWPLVSWLGVFRPDPLRRLRLGPGAGESRPTTLNRTSLPAAGPVEKARVDRALRGLESSLTLPPRWAQAVSVAAAAGREALPELLDEAVAGVDLAVDRNSLWWWPVRLLQWLLVVAMVVGFGWLLLPAAAVLLGMNPPEPVTWFGLPGSWVLVGVGFMAGSVVGLVGRTLVAAGASAKARRAERSLLRAVAEVAAAQVDTPVEEILERHRRAITAAKRVRVS